MGLDSSHQSGLTFFIGLYHYRNGDLPKFFDSRVKWDSCSDMISTIVDQGSCSSCWAVAATSAMSDRLCIHSPGHLQKHISAENLLACCSNCGYKCGGGYPGMAWMYWYSTGIVTGKTKNVCFSKQMFSA